MSMFASKCQRCGGDLTFAVGEDGMFINCPKCKTTEKFEDPPVEQQTYTRPIAFTLSLIGHVMQTNAQILDQLGEITTRLVNLEQRFEELRRKYGGLD